MELQVLISKKGTRVVKASQLHLALELPKAQYPRNIKRWLTDIYGFQDGIRNPLRLQDYAKKPLKDSVLDEYYLTLEFAKLITLSSNSKVKHKYAKWLYAMEDRLESEGLFNLKQIEAVVELAKVMGLESCQSASEQQHLQQYEDRNGGTGAHWWRFRSHILGYSVEGLRRRMQELGKSYKGKTQRQMLLQIDKYEVVRTAVIDLFMALGKSDRYARQLGDLAKLFARELNVEILDDRRNQMNAFTSGINPQLVKEVKSLEKGQILSVWQQ